MARLDLYVNYELQASIRLDGAELLLGRDPGCAVQIPDPKVSRRHAVIHTVNGSHIIENLGTNGTKVNGKPLDTRQILHSGDAIFISSYILVYQHGETPATGPAETVLLRR